MVMGVSAGIVTRVPNLLNIPHGLRLFAIHAFYQGAVHFLAEAHSCRVNLQSLVEKVIFAGNDIHKVADAARRVI